MADATERYITQTKLRELRKQRENLQAIYTALTQQAAQHEHLGDRLRVLYTGLQALHASTPGVAEDPQRGHPDVANLELLLAMVAQGGASPALVQFWYERLQREVAQGQRRAEIVYLFGALLEAWATQEQRGDTDTEGLEARTTIQQELLGAITTAGPTTAPMAALDPLVDILLGHLAPAVDVLGRVMAQEVHAPISRQELEGILTAMRDDIYRPSALRRQAQRFLAQPLLCHELADALTIELANLDAWAWPSAGLAPHLLWTRNKWRLFVHESFPTACLLEVVGQRWQQSLSWLLGPSQADHHTRVARLEAAEVPAAVLEAERQRWEGVAWTLEALASPHEGWLEDQEREDDGEDITLVEGHSVVALRAAAQAKLHDLRHSERYQEGPYGSAVQLALSLINAEIQLTRAAFPQQPLYVIKADLQDYYASLSHDMLLALLQRLGLPAPDVGFFQRFLRIPLVDSGAVTEAVRGVPNGHRLSDLLAELVLWLLDQHLAQAAPVQVIRFLDDICILARSEQAALSAWQALTAFCEAWGLALNADKCGSITIGGAPLAELPAAPPTWLLLQLAPDGSWHPYQQGWELHLAQTRQRVLQAPTLLSRVALYNANLTYLANALALGAALGRDHRQRVGLALSRFRRDFLGPDQPIELLFWQEIRERLGPQSETLDLPDAWLYWPLTAGGLGLRHAEMLAQQYAPPASRREMPPPARMPGWLREWNGWARFYQSHLQPVRPRAPQETLLMATLVQDFIQRGAELTEGHQHDLAPYWRWVLYTYGPQLLEAFGSFRFLMTELVPFQLIVQQRLDDTSLYQDAGVPQ